MFIQTEYKKNQGNLTLTLIFASIKKIIKIFGVILIYGYVYKKQSHLFKTHTKIFKDEMIWYLIFALNNPVWDKKGKFRWNKFGHEFITTEAEYIGVYETIFSAFVYVYNFPL